VAIIDPDEVLGLGTGAIEAADLIAGIGRDAQRLIDDVASDVPGVIAPDIGRVLAAIAADLADQGLIAKTRAEDLLSNERPLSGLADLVGADYWTPAPRDPEHPLAHEFTGPDVALPDAMVDRYLPAGGESDPSAVAPARTWSALPPAGPDEAPVAAGRRGVQAGLQVGGADARLVTGADTAVAAAAGGLAGVAAGMTSGVAARIETRGGVHTDGE
jgi:hypothetical protein